MSYDLAQPFDPEIHARVDPTKSGPATVKRIEDQGYRFNRRTGEILVESTIPHLFFHLRLVPGKECKYLVELLMLEPDLC